jgi:hypothetical protein
MKLKLPIVFAFLFVSNYTYAPDLSNLGQQIKVFQYSFDFII